MGQALAPATARIRRRGEVAQHMLVEEMGEGPVADVVQQPGKPQRLDHEAFGRELRVGFRFGQCSPQAGVEVAGPQTRFVHYAQTVGEAAVLGRREDPASALQLTDAAHPLEPHGIEQVALGRLFGRQSERLRALGSETLGQLNVAVDRIADEIDSP